MGMNYRIIGENDYIETKGSVICLGNFDGVHIGHQKLIESAVSIAQKENLTSIFFTIFPSPKSVLGKREEKYLTNLNDRTIIAKSMGIDEVIVLRFNLEVAHYHYEEFIQKIILKYNPKYIVCGNDFNFGYKGEGKIQHLQNHGNGIFKVIVVNDVEVNHDKVSTTRIIELLKKHDVKKVAEYLGRNYRVVGTVVKGHGNGTKLGYPTANIDIKQYFLPARGVYAVYVDINGKRYRGMANIGTHPTIAQLEKEILEVHIFDFEESIYGQQICIEFFDFIRLERRFSNLEDLQSQLSQDIVNINRLLF